MKKYIAVKDNKGVTLIALVITIIVLLILAGVSIATLLGENGIINKAKLAKEETEKSNVLEKVQIEVAGGFNTDGEYDTNIIKKNLENNLGATVTKVNNSLNVELDGTKVKVKPYGKVEFAKKVERPGIKIGDYIEYKPTPNSNPSEQKMTQDTDMTWRVLRIHEDGTIDLLGNETKQTVRFAGAEGYNNGVTIMNKICRDLYSNKEHGIVARSINQEDIEATYKPGSAAEKAKENIKNAQPVEYDGTNKSTGEPYENRWYPAIYEKEIGSNIDGVEKGTLGPSDESEIIVGDERTVQRKKANENIRAQKNYYGNFRIYELGIGKNKSELIDTNKGYWLASRYVYTKEENIHLGIRLISQNKNEGFMGYYLIDSNGKDRKFEFSLRPMISLESDVKIVASENASTVEGAHKIEW